MRAVNKFLIGLVLIFSLPALASETLLQDTDTVHFDLKEWWNRSAQEKSIFIELSLCAAFAPVHVGDQPQCVVIGRSQVLTVPAGANGNVKGATPPPKILKMMAGGQDRLAGTDFNRFADELAAAMSKADPSGEKKIEYRMELTVRETGTDAKDPMRAFILLPELQQEPQVLELGKPDAFLLQNKVVVSATTQTQDQDLKTRISFVVKRTNQNQK